MSTELEPHDARVITPGGITRSVRPDGRGNCRPAMATTPEHMRDAAWNETALSIPTLGATWGESDARRPGISTGRGVAALAEAPVAAVAEKDEPARLKPLPLQLSQDLGNIDGNFKRAPG